MNVEEIKTIVKLMSDHDLTEFKISAEDYNLCIRRGSGEKAVMATPMMAAPMMAAPVAAPVAAPAAAPAEKAAPAAAPAESAAPANTIDSPLVGTFYLASSPDSASFVQVGDRVNADSVIGIIEAMKVMNEIKAEKSGVVKQILVENGQPVEYGQPLLVLE